MTTTQLIDLAKAILKLDEGYSNKPYLDTAEKITIGIGHNLSDKGLSEEVINIIFKEDFLSSLTDARSIFPDFDGWPLGRQVAIINMIFNLGKRKFSEFKKMISAIKKGDWNSASEEALNSKWAIQTGKRAVRIAQVLKSGDLKKVYNIDY